jgi:anaerobic magnesium-protoporphyrin IX monomethyl ester cyclase
MDCLIIGFYDSDFPEYVEMVKSMGETSGAYRDLNLAFINFDGKPHRSMDMLNRFYFEDKGAPARPFNNADFLWPVVTYLGTYLTKKGYSFDYVNLPHLEKDKLRDKLSGDDILTIAITTTLYVSAHPILELIALIRQYNTTAKIIVGGPFISNQPKLGDFIALQRLFKYIGADIYVISQEGEAALVNILSALKNKASLDGVENIAYRQGERYVTTSTSIESNTLEENMVDYSLFPAAEIGEFVTLRTAKSCPFSCSFCGFPQRAGKYKYLSVELVEKELNAIREIGGVTTLTFIDDTFNVPKERFREMLRMMIRNQYGFKWNSFYRSDHGDEQTIELMGRAGCEGVFLGIESGSDEMLARMNKTSRRKNYLQAIPLLREAGISTHANVIVGFPGETHDTYQETVDLIEAARPDFYRAQLWYADPVTPIWNQRDEYGVKGSSFNWSHNTMDYQTACALVDRLFLAVEGSVWLPQNGFEQWSTFYLQRRGMALDQIKTFLKCFNAAIKEKLLDPVNEAASPERIEALKVSCKFDQAAKPDMTAIEILSGSRFTAAESYWMAESATAATGEGLLKLNGNHRRDHAGVDSVATSAAADMLESLQAECRAELCSVLLAAYGVLLSRLDGREGTAVIAAINRPGARGVIPLFLNASWDMTFRELVKATARKTVEGMRHEMYAFAILSNLYRVAAQDLPAPVFRFGFAYSEDDPQRDSQDSDAPLLPAPLSDSLGLILRAARRGGNVHLALSAVPDWFDGEAANQLGHYLTAILEQVSHNPDTRLGEIQVERWAKTAELTFKADAGEEFNF